MTEAGILVLKRELEAKLAQRADLKKAVDALPSRGPQNVKTREKFSERIRQLDREIERLRERIIPKEHPPDWGEHPSG